MKKEKIIDVVIMEVKAHTVDGCLIMSKNALADYIYKKHKRKISGTRGSVLAAISDVTTGRVIGNYDYSSKGCVCLSVNDIPMPEEITETTTFMFPRRYKNTGIITDLHIPYHDPEAIKTVVRWFIEMNIDSLLLMGDIVDFYQGSHYVKDPSKKNMAYEIEKFIEFITWIKKVLPGVAIFYKYGNHEMRFQTSIFRNSPALYGLPLSKLDENMKLTENDITPIGYYQPINIHDIMGYHGHEIRMTENIISPARTLSLKFNTSSFIGHCHRTTNYDVAYDDKTVSFYSIGSLCQKKQVYNPFANKWTHGAARIFLNEDNVAIFENKQIKNGVLCF